MCWLSGVLSVRLGWNCIRNLGAAMEAEYHRQFSQQLDAWMDAGAGECLLRDPALRQHLVERFRYGDGDLYALHARVIMPNHVHVLFSLKPGQVLEKTVGTWKNLSARRINAAVGRSGTLCQEDYFDRLIRDGERFAACVRYIRRNPVRAKLPAGEYAHYESELARRYAPSASP